MTRLFRVFIPTSILGLLISEILLIAGLLTAAIWWQFEGAWLYLQYEYGAWQVLVLTLAILLGLYLNDCYDRIHKYSRLVFSQQLCLIIGSAFILQAFFAYANLPLQMPRRAMLAGNIAILIVLPLWRSVYNKLSLSIFGAEKLLFIGTHPLQWTLANHFQEHPEIAIQPIGFLAEDASTAPQDSPLPLLGMVSDMGALLHKGFCERIIVGITTGWEMQALPLMIQLQQQSNRVHVQTVEQAYEVFFCRVSLSQSGLTKMTFDNRLRPSTITLKLQEAYSWLVAFIIVIVLLPIMIVAAIAVWLSSPGPVLFRQTRSGQWSKSFTIFKFRSMYVDAEAGGAVWAQENDPRVTPVGRILRKYRIDELPQLFNVLRGEMSIVGPRPERPEFISVLSKEIPYYMQRLSVKPGITGWAQINYRYGNTVEDTMVKLEYDLYYIKNLSAQLDFYIMFHTAKTMLLTRGAY